MVNLERTSCSPSVEMLTPSMYIAPPAPSMSRNRAKVKDDFPAPVLPTIPTYKYRLHVHSSCKTGYLNIAELIF